MSDPPNQMDPRFKGRLLVVMAAILWSTSGFFTKSPTFDSWPEQSRGLLFAFWRALFAAVILGFLVRRVTWDWRLLLSAGIFAFMNVTYLSAMVQCEATLAIWLQYTSPIWVLLVSWLILGERPGGNEWLEWTLICGGVLIILFGQPPAENWYGIGLGLLSGIGFAGVVISLRGLRDLDGAWIVFVNHLLTAIVLFPFVWRAGVWPSGQQWGMLAAFGMLQLGIPYALFAQSVKKLESNEASALTLLEPMFVPVWVFLFYRDLAAYQWPSWGTLTGGGFIIAGLSYRFLRIRSKPPRKFGES